MYQEAKSHSPIAHCTLSLYFFGENLHTNIVNFIQVEHNTFQKNHYISKVSFKAFLGNLNCLKNDDMQSKWQPLNEEAKSGFSFCCCVKGLGFFKWGSKYHTPAASVRE